MAGEILEYLVLSALIALFTFCFLYFTSLSLADTWLSAREISLNAPQEGTLEIWIGSVCLIASICIFIVLFLMMLGQKLSYLVEIIGGIDRLRDRETEFRIPEEGEDELTLLAENMNLLSLSWRQLAQKEQEIREQREAWIRSLSHDIRTPLTSMLAGSECLLERQGADREELEACISLMRAKAEQIRDLADQLLERKEGGPERVENMRLLLEQLMQEWEEVLEERFRCEIDLTGCSSAGGYVDPLALRRILDNLASNVEKYADPRQKVSLVAENREDRLILVQENGRAEERNNAEKSHSIGLANVRKLAADLGGSAEEEIASDRFRIRIVLKIRRDL